MPATPTLERQRKKDSQGKANFSYVASVWPVCFMTASHKTKTRAVEMAQLIKCLACKHEDLSSVPRTHAGKRLSLVASAQLDCWGSLASQPSLRSTCGSIVDFASRAKKGWMAFEKQHLRLSTGLPILCHTHTHT